MKDHTESILIEFDKKYTDYERILQKWKEIVHPYETKRQYRASIFFLNEGQEGIARRIVGDMDHVDIEKATKFWLAEQRHQDFLAKL